VGDLTVIHSHPISLLKINLQQRMQNPDKFRGLPFHGAPAATLFYSLDSSHSWLSIL
jgi:hypothetical protein